MKRLVKDHVALRKDIPPNYLFESEAEEELPDDLTQLLICLTGPQGTPFIEGCWKLRLSIPAEYPIKPPTASFVTKIFHPNVAEDTGAVCLETLKRDWDQKLTLRDILLHISCLLIQPNPDSALNQKAGVLLQEDYEAFSKQAKLMTRIHAPTPARLKAAADAARQRGDDADDVLKETRQAHNATGQSTKPVEAEKARKRSFNDMDDNNEQEDRRRKSPKHAHSKDHTSDLPVKIFTAGIIQPTKDYPRSNKVVFRASWAKPGNVLVRTGIRRL